MSANQHNVVQDIFLSLQYIFLFLQHIFLFLQHMFLSVFRDKICCMRSWKNTNLAARATYLALCVQPILTYMQHILRDRARYVSILRNALVSLSWLWFLHLISYLLELCSIMVKHFSYILKHVLLRKTMINYVMKHELWLKACIINTIMLFCHELWLEHA